MNNSNSNAFRTGTETLFLINILNTMYNDNLRQIINFTDALNNLNNSNNQIRNLLVQLLSVNQGNGNGNGNSRRNNSRRYDNIDYNNISANENNRNIGYLIGEYTIPINRNRYNNNNTNRNRHSTMDNYARSIFENFLQPIEIYPTQSQIEVATRRVRYGDIVRPINMSCPISMDEFNENDMVILIRHCGHIFHDEHIMNWFRSNCRCPVCRYDIREYNSNVSNQFLNNNQDSSGNNVERNDNNNNTLFDENTTNIVSNSIENFLLNSIFDPSGNYTNNQMVYGLHDIINILNNRNHNF